MENIPTINDNVEKVSTMKYFFDNVENVSTMKYFSHKGTKLFANWCSFGNVSKVTDNHQLISTIAQFCLDSHQNLRQNYITYRQSNKYSTLGAIRRNATWDKQICFIQL